MKKPGFWEKWSSSELVTEDEARALAAAHTIPLVGLGGTQDGIIGALAAVGLARAIAGYVVFGALGGLLGGLTLLALRRAGFFAYLAEKR